ncbi:MAG: class I SAM-dependent RNA methyltransferase [Acidobacteria bacterium]|nr:class I SAM-dependent RNA methyltransferase [Acidobacteriota bacterium]
MKPDQTNPPASRETEIVVEKLVYGGDGLGREDGRVVLVPYVLPGERVRVSLRQEKADVAHGELRAVIEAAPERVPPACPHFARCGGCHYQHQDYAGELRHKEAILRETLRRVGRIHAPPDIEVVAGPDYGYRNRIQLHFDRRRMGFMAAGSHDVWPVDVCPVSSPRLNQALAALGEMAGDRRFPAFLHSLELFTNETAVQLNVRSSERGVARAFFDWCAEQIPGATTGAVEYPAAGEMFRVGRRSFFQVNRFLADRLVETALGGAQGETAVDLFAGAGLFTLPLARRFGKVEAVEAGESAARDLAFNAARAGLKVGVHRAMADAYLGGLSEAPDLVLADTPRVGLWRDVVRRLLALCPATLIVVSCDPATLARDLAALLGGGYSLTRLALVDLFPRTCHLESVAELKFQSAAA